MTEVVFSSVDVVDVSLDFYLPAGASKASPVPILVWWHGGGLIQVRLPPSFSQLLC